MEADDDVIRRWRLNAVLAGVHLRDEDVARMVERGQLERVRAVEALVERLNARETVPDYLDILATEPASRDGGRSDG